MIQVDSLLRQLGEVSTGLETVATQARETEQAVMTAARAVSDASAKAASEVEAAATKVEGSTQRIRTAVATTRQETDELLAELENRQATRLDDLLHTLEQHQTQWSQTLQLAIGELQDGALKFDDFLRRFGDWEIVVNGAQQRVEDLLAGMDPREFEDRVQTIQKALNRGLLDLEGIMDQLAGLQNRYAQELLKTLQLYQQNKVTLEQVLEVARQAQQSFAGGQTSALAGELENLLRGAQRQGAI